MKTKSSPARSRRKSLDPHPPLPERFGSRETTTVPPDTSRDERRDVPQKNGGLGTGSSESQIFEECIVCEVSDERVTRCSGFDCPIWYHEECLTPDVGGSDDLSNPFCPFCWYKFVSLKSKKKREEALAAKKAALEFLDKDFVHGQGLQGGEHAECSSKEGHLDNNSHQPEAEGTAMEEDDGTEDEIEASSEDEEMVAADNVHGAEGDGEPAQVQTQVNEGKRRRVEMDANETMELDGEDVSERGAATNVSAQPNTLRNMSFFNKGPRRRRLWTPEEEHTLKVGVEKFAAVSRKNMPWRKILEMGKNVFHETRKPTDLKDKWKNIMKAQH